MARTKKRWTLNIFKWVSIACQCLLSQPSGGGHAQALEELFESGDVLRSDLVISTKLFDGGNGINDRGLSRKHIVEGMQAALQRMRLAYVDLVFCHRPDVTTPMEETVRAMNHIIDRGKSAEGVEI